MPKISVSPTESRNNSIPYSRPFRAWAKTSARRVRRSPGKRAAGAGVPDVRDPVDDDVGQLAVDLPHLSDVDEGLDHVLGPRVEPEAAARAVEFDPAQGLEHSRSPNSSYWRASLTACEPEKNAYTTFGAAWLILVRNGAKSSLTGNGV